MNEFIEKLIERLEEVAIETLGISKGQFAIDKGEYSSYNSLSLCDVKEQANQLAEEYNDGWIPVSSGRLPELFGNLEEDEYISSDVVLIADEKNQWMGFYVKTLAEEGWMFADCGTGQKIDWTEIKYWQPLPYQPKRE